MTDRLVIEFQQCPECGRWTFESSLKELGKDVPPSVIRRALAEELEMWEEAYEQSCREQEFLKEHRN